MLLIEGIWGERLEALLSYYKTQIFDVVRVASCSTGMKALHFSATTNLLCCLIVLTILQGFSYPVILLIGINRSKIIQNLLLNVSKW